MCRVIACLIILTSLILLPGCAEEEMPTYDPEPLPNVLPVETILLEESVKVGPGTYRAWEFSLLIGSELHGEIASNSDVNVWFLSPREYTAFQAGDTFYCEKEASRERTLGYKFIYAVQGSHKYYLVLDNRFSWITSKDVSVYLKSVQ